MDEYKQIESVKITKLKEFKKNSKSIKAISTLAGCIILNLFIGCMYIWSNISVYVISYFYLYDKTLSYDSAFYVDTIFKMLQIISSLFGIYLTN